MEAKSEIVSAIDLSRFKRVTGMGFHDDRHVRLDVDLGDEWGAAFVDVERAEVASLKLLRETAHSEFDGQSDTWFRLDDGIAMLRGTSVRVWPDPRSDAFFTYPIANPDHFATDPMVLADEFRRRPNLLHVGSMHAGSTIALYSDNFYMRGGRYLARLEFRDNAFHWVGAYRQIEEPELAGGWVDRNFSLHETPLINSIHVDGEDVSCVTRGGTATMLNHGPAYQINLIIRYSAPRPAAQPARGFSLKGLFSRKREATQPFTFKDIVARPEGLVVFDGRTGRHAVKLHQKNRLEFYQPTGERPFAALPLTPKRNLGKLNHNKVRLALRDDLLVVCGQEHMNLCRIEMP